MAKNPSFILMQFSPPYYHDEIITSIFCTLDQSEKLGSVQNNSTFSQQTLPSLISENAILKVTTNKTARAVMKFLPFEIISE